MTQETSEFTFGRAGESQRSARLRSITDFVRRLLRVRFARSSMTFILLVITAAVFAPLLAPYNPSVQDPFNGLASFSGDHWLGTDELGRDVLSRLIYGSRVSLQIGVGAVTFGLLIGVPIGVISGYARGLVDDILMRMMDAVVAFPGLVLALALVAAAGPSKTSLIVAIGIGNVPWLARVARSQVLSVGQQDYVMAARAVGAPPARIMAGHIAPNALQPVIVQASLNVGYAILAEAALSFLGVGVPPPTPSWGSMLQFAFNHISDDPWLSVIPGAAIFLLVLSFNLLGDALRDALDPKLRRS